MGEQMTAELVLGALNMALHTRRPETVIHHSDQGNPRRRHSALSYLSSSTSKGNISSTKTAPKNTGCPPRRSVRRKRRPPPWTTLHLCNHPLENQALTCAWMGSRPGSAAAEPSQRWTPIQHHQRDATQRHANPQDGCGREVLLLAKSEIADGDDQQRCAHRDQGNQARGDVVH